ncbi:hypothetical protein UFOVP153_58 [uncultured Caudovirales phage]|uniref:Uncharacterized protein n=1 Tax=uncultured Caudovirales phage TaxID=2100421 RepID=A0A6J5KYD4_9CAUD|nr:hypothetical protein UFOVP69_65 [uncultured Caudovirales phage]CAB5171069.1 hypothetical protein UFOVP153_58 [uncultured Caudovirales phage]
MSDRGIITAIQKIAGTFQEDKVRLLVGTVESIQGNTCTCLINDQSSLGGINLQAGVCDGVLSIPSIGSTVVIMLSTQINPFVVLYSDIDKAYIQVGIASIEMLPDGSITLNDGTDGGLVKGDPLVEKLNNLENKVNELITTFNAHTHNVISIGSPTATAIPTISGELTPTKATDIESESIRYGK